MVVFTYKNYLEYERYLKDTKEEREKEKEQANLKVESRVGVSKEFLNKLIHNNNLQKETESQEQSVLHDIESEYKYSNNNLINNEHDKVFRMILDKKENAVSLINKALGEETVKEEQIEKYNSSFITEMFENRESDVVYKLKGKRIFFLIEHQTKIDYSMPFRILDYEYLIMKSAIDQNKIKSKTYKLPLVIPIVLYTGKQKWNAKQYLEEKQEKFKNYDCKLGYYNLIDINDYTEQELLSNKMLISNMLLLEKAKNKEETIEYLEKTVKNTKAEDKELFQRIIEVIFERKIGKEAANKLIKELKGGKKDMWAIMEMLDEETKKDIEKGRKESVIQIAKEMLKEKLPIEMIVKITKLSKKEVENLYKTL